MPVVLGFFLITACEEKYWPELGDKYDDVLVVDGMIINEPGPYTVKLSHSSRLNYPKYFPVSGYEVIISDNEGDTEILDETSEGVYQTNVDGIQGVIGKSYKLTVHDPLGKRYESAFEELLAPVAIDTVYANIEYRANDNFPMDIPGYQFYISTATGPSDTNYVRWQLIQTYKYKVDYQIFFYYDGTLHDFPDPDSLETCYKTDFIYSIFTASTAGLTQPVIKDFPLHYVSFDTREFSIRYSLLINQLTISSQAYGYWKSVDEMNTAGGSLYTQLPYQIRGNLKNINDDEEPVLGYFHVAGLSKKRIFINRNSDIGPMYYPLCTLTESDYQDYGWMFRVRDWREWPKYVTVDNNGARAVPNKDCVDCRKSGGSIEIPDFWEE